MDAREVPGTTSYTKAELAVGDLITPGFGGNFVERGLKHIYVSATLEAASRGAKLAKGEGRGRIYIVEPTAEFEDDPNLTDKKFPGNTTASYRLLDPLGIVGEGWASHPPEQLEAMRDGLARLNGEERADIIECLSASARLTHHGSPGKWRGASFASPGRGAPPSVV